MQTIRPILNGLLVVGLLFGNAALASADESQPVKWKVGPAFRQELAQSADLGWKDRSLHEGLVRLAEVHGVAIFLDRRIDPNQSMTLTKSDEPLHHLLGEIAASAGATVSTIEPVVYMGPAATGAKLATLAALRRQEVAKLPNDAKARLLRTAPWQWDELAQPRELLEDLARQAGVRIENPDAVPLDLWPAGNLPPMAWLDRFTLLLAGFDLTFQIAEDGKSVRLVTAPRDAVVEKSYSPRGSAAELASQFRRLLPEASVKVEQGKLLIAARQEDHEKIERLLSGQSVRTTKPVKDGGEKLYTMTVEQEQAGNVVKSVAQLLGKELKYDPSLLPKLKKPVELKLKDATLDYLMEMTLKPLGLTYRMTDTTLEILPAN